MRYVLDSCALIAMFYDEPGGEIVTELISDAKANSVQIWMNKVNLLEFYYDSLRRQGKKGAQDGMSLVNDSPIKIIPWLSNEVFEEAGRLKATYKSPWLIPSHWLRRERRTPRLSPATTTNSTCWSGPARLHSSGYAKLNQILGRQRCRPILFLSLSSQIHTISSMLLLVLKYPRQSP